MLKQGLKSPARILRFKQPFHSSPFSLFPVTSPQEGKVDFKGNRTILIAMIMSLSALAWIWYLIKAGITSIPAWAWCLIAPVSGTLFGLSFSIKKVKRWIRISAIISTLAMLLISAFGVYHLTETQEEKRLNETIQNQKATIEFLRGQLEREEILADTRVKVGENPHFISGDFVDDQPLIEVLPYPRPTSVLFTEDIKFTNIINDISLTNTDEGVTIHSKNFDCQLSTARPKENLSAGSYIANLTVALCVLWRTESGEFEKIEGESKKYQTKFIVAKEFRIETVSVWMKPMEKGLFWGPSALEPTLTYILTKSADSVEILVRDHTEKIIRSTKPIYDPTTGKFIPESPPPGYAGYNEFPLCEFPAGFLFRLFPHKFELKVKKGKKEISKITLLFISTLPKEKGP